jgi:hypothetical protein
VILTPVFRVQPGCDSAGASIWLVQPYSNPTVVAAGQKLGRPHRIVDTSAADIGLLRW